MSKSWTLNIKTVSEANCFEPWQKKHKRHQLQKRIIRLWSVENRIGSTSLPCIIKLTRLSPSNGLDEDDNLRMSLKYLKDYIADQILPNQAAGRADSDKRIKWEYSQEKHPIYAVKIEISSDAVP